MLLYNEDILDVEHQILLNGINTRILADNTLKGFNSKYNCFGAYDLHPYDAVRELNFILEKDLNPQT